MPKGGKRKPRANVAVDAVEVTLRWREGGGAPGEPWSDGFFFTDLTGWI